MTLQIWKGYVGFLNFLFLSTYIHTNIHTYMYLSSTHEGFLQVSLVVHVCLTFWNAQILS